MGKKKYVCLFGLIDFCEARRFVEKAAKEREARFAEQGKAELKARVGRIVQHVRFDDRKVMEQMFDQLTPFIEDMGRAVARGMGMKVERMADFCRMCPKRERELMKPLPARPARVY